MQNALKKNIFGKNLSIQKDFGWMYYEINICLKMTTINIYMTGLP